MATPRFIAAHHRVETCKRSTNPQGLKHLRMKGTKSSHSTHLRACMSGAPRPLLVDFPLSHAARALAASRLSRADADLSPAGPLCLLRAPSEAPSLRSVPPHGPRTEAHRCRRPQTWARDDVQNPTSLRLATFALRAPKWQTDRLGATCGTHRSCASPTLGLAPSVGNQEITICDKELCIERSALKGEASYLSPLAIPAKHENIC